jgi:hypothetical protein
MIRVGLPLPTFHRLAFRRQAAGRRARIGERVRRSIADWYNVTIPLQLNALRDRQADREIRRSASLLPGFEERFEELVDILCWSAKDGNHAGRDERYAEVRSWLLARYDAFHRGLRHFLPENDGLAETDQPGLAAARDAFESLFLPADVTDNIHSVTVIERIGRARAALEAYRAHVGDPDP